MGEISILLAKISNALDDNQLWEKGIELNWETICEIYNIVDEVGYYHGSYFNPYAIDIIARNILKKDFTLFQRVFIYIAHRYDVLELVDYLNEYDYLFEGNQEIVFENEMDANELKMFISFNSNDDKEAIKIQEFFINCGVDCFLSKTSIDISEEYKTRAFSEICKADIFIYLLSENSKASDWCDQEMGMAYMKHKFGKAEIFVVSHDGTDPYGFLSSFNAGFTYNSNYLLDIARKIDEDFGSSLVAKIKLYYDGLINSKIKELFIVKSYTSARKLLNFINNRTELLDENQLERICKAAIINDQIYGCIICKEPLIKILSKHKESISDDLFQEVFNKINYVG